MSCVEFVAGWISGAVGMAVGHPLDTVKVRLQTQSGYRGIMDCVIRTYRYEGVPGFFKGMCFPILSIAACNSVVFGAYSRALDVLAPRDRGVHERAPPSPLAVFLAGCFSGAAQVVFSAPVDMVKVRLQNQTQHWQAGAGGPGGPGARYRGPLHCLVSILRQEGLRGLYRGLGALALRDVPCYGLFFLQYVLVCRALSPAGQPPGTLAVLAAGGTAGVVTWASATPMDVVKARLQMDGQGSQRYRGILHCITDSVRSEGVTVLFKGLWLNSLRAFPVNAITFLSNESLVRALTSSDPTCSGP